MLEPYSDSPSSVGLPTTPTESIAEIARIALENGVQLCMHAIGDRANREVLNIYERAFKARPDLKDLRWRIEHAQHISAADIPRFGQLGVIAAMQGIHATSDAPYVLARLGAKRAEEGAYVWQKLMKSGAHHRQRHRRAGRAHRSDGEFLRDRSPARRRTARCSSAIRRCRAPRR